jgi:hypothetical protein
MAEIPKDVKRRLFQGGAKQQIWLMASFVFTCWACLIVGIVGDAMDKTLGLETTTWLIISIGFLLAGVWHWFKAYHAAKEE